MSLGMADAILNIDPQTQIIVGSYGTDLEQLYEEFPEDLPWFANGQQDKTRFLDKPKV
jgi:hypothetical protein